MYKHILDRNNMYNNNNNNNCLFFRCLIVIVINITCIYANINDSLDHLDNYLPIRGVKITTKTVGFQWETSCRHGSPEKCKGIPRRPYYYTAATITVQFNESIKYKGDDSNTGLAGSSRLICGETIFESYEIHPKNRDFESGLGFILENPPKYLVPINRRKNSSRNIHQLFSTSNSMSNNYFSREYEAYLILNFSVVHGFTHSYFDEDDLEDCTITFLPIDEQPKFSKIELLAQVNNSFTKGKKAQQKLIVGTSKPFGSYLTSEQKSNDEKCNSVNDVLSNSLQINLRNMYLLAKMHNATRKGKLMSLAELSESDMMQLQTRWQGVGNFMDAVSEIINPIITQIWESLMGFFLVSNAGQVANMVTDNIPDAISENVHTTIQHILAPMIGGMLPNKVMLAVHEQLPDSIIEAVTAALDEVVPSMITENLAPMLVTSLTASLSQSIGVKATQDMGEHISRKTSNSLNTLLGKSLTHSIVPTLLHTMSHNPLQDYYCYYCFHHKTYCQYCNYAPSQLYYAMYYAGFYSTYYTNYYPEAFAAAEEQTQAADDKGFAGRL